MCTCVYAITIRFIKNCSLDRSEVRYTRHRRWNNNIIATIYTRKCMYIYI